MDGGRCFFLDNVQSSWTDAWIQCQQHPGATLAQIHTSVEYDKIFQMMLVRGELQSHSQESENWFS
jgi:hypothetical protein